MAFDHTRVGCLSMLAGLSRLLEREVEGCNRGGRGAIEIDILEVLPGKDAPNYREDKAVDLSCAVWVW